MWKDIIEGRSWDKIIDGIRRFGNKEYKIIIKWDIDKKIKGWEWEV